MEIVTAQAAHVAGIQQIYAWHVLNGLATFETEPPTAEEMLARLAKVQESGGFWLVALEEHRIPAGDDRRRQQ